MLNGIILLLRRSSSSSNSRCFDESDVEAVGKVEVSDDGGEVVDQVEVLVVLRFDDDDDVLLVVVLSMF